MIYTYIHNIIFKIFNIYYIYIYTLNLSFLFYKLPRTLLLIQNVSKTITRKRTSRNLLDGVRANTIPLGTSLHVKGGSSFVHAVDRQDPMGTFPCRHVWQGCNRRSTRPLRETSLSRISFPSQHRKLYIYSQLHKFIVIKQKVVFFLRNSNVYIWVIVERENTILRSILRNIGVSHGEFYITHVAQF